MKTLEHLANFRKLVFNKDIDAIEANYGTSTWVVDTLETNLDWATKYPQFASLAAQVLQTAVHVNNYNTLGVDDVTNHFEKLGVDDVINHFEKLGWELYQILVQSVLEHEGYIPESTIEVIEAELIGQLKVIAQASAIINELTYDDEHIMNLVSNEKYPFGKSFDEFVIDLSEYIEDLE